MVSGCGSSEAPMDLSAPVDLGSDLSADPSLLLGLWQEPQSGYIWRFTADGNQALGATEATIDSSPLTAGTWLLRGITLILDNTVGFCAAPVTNQVGTFTITLDAAHLTFKLVDDPCPERSTIDGETWTRPMPGD
jgi:hypothetical protein